MAGAGLLGAAGPWRPAGVALEAGVARAVEAEAAGVAGVVGVAGAAGAAQQARPAGAGRAKQTLWIPGPAQQCDCEQRIVAM